jgi:PBP1b-binding outer membrane lipoprotein LpoB
MKISPIILVQCLLLTAVAFMTGCATAPTRIQAGGPTAVTTMGVDLADFKNTAGAMVKELLVHPAITTFPQQNGGKLPAINVGKILNKSDINIDMGQIAGRINEDLLNSGTVELIATDAGARDANAQDAFESDRKNNNDGKADYYLEGEIMVLAAREGKLREKNYTFQLRLNDRNRRVRWQRSVDVSKQRRAGGVAW